jgi:hypothetical protein
MKNLIAVAAVAALGTGVALAQTSAPPSSSTSSPSSPTYPSNSNPSNSNPSSSTPSNSNPMPSGSSDSNSSSNTSKKQNSRYHDCNPGQDQSRVNCTQRSTTTGASNSTTPQQ